MKTINYIVQSFKLGKGLVSTNHDQRFLQWALDGFKKLNEYQLVPEMLKVERLPIKLDGNTPYADLPIGFTEMIRMGVCCKGVLINFDKNDALCIPTDNPCPCDPTDIANQIECYANNNNATTPTNTWMYGNPANFNLYGSQYTASVYGVGVGFNHGGYRIDYAKRRIIFERCLHIDECVLEYLSGIEAVNGNAVVPDGMIEAIRLWIDYEAKYNSINPQESRRSGEARTRWYQVVRDLNSRQQAMTKDQWLNLIRSYCYEEIIE